MIGIRDAALGSDIDRFSAGVWKQCVAVIRSRYYVDARQYKHGSEFVTSYQLSNLLQRIEIEE